MKDTFRSHHLKHSYVCISLQSAPERRRLMTDQFAKAGITARFFDAVELKDGGNAIPGYDESEHIRRAGRGLSRGEIGCYLSHRKVWQQLLDSSDDTYCVLEDDVILDTGFRQTVEAIVARSAELDIVRLSTRTPRDLRLSYVKLHTGARVHWTRQCASGSHGYTITRRAAHAMLKCTERMLDPIDHELTRCWEHRQKVLALHPPAIRLADLSSTIRDRHGVRRAGMLARRLTGIRYRWEVLRQKIRALVWPGQWKKKMGQAS
ncbi:MAG: glycosyltransferase family 25 protein [Janthinobacterium lividum]